MSAASVVIRVIILIPVLGALGCGGGSADTTEAPPTDAQPAQDAAPSTCDPSCQAWETCEPPNCVLSADRCVTADDCQADETCDESHRCAAVPAPCEGVDCSDHGLCEAATGAPRCACEPGYEGPACGACASTHVKLNDGTCAPDPCPDLTCSAHAACEVDVETGTASCVCDAGYIGVGCDACAVDYYEYGDKCVSSILFALPMANPGGSMISLPVIGFDNDPAAGTSAMDCESYEGQAFPYCYDDHTGTDFLLKGGFTTMDAGSTSVLAAAAGEVIDAHDGEFDRCRADLLTQEVVCPGYDHVTPANYVKLRHVDGKQTFYWHLKKDSVVVAVGDWVECGAPLGLVGSSGLSSAPHLHFTVVLESGEPVDPYAGPSSHPDTHWVEQTGANGLPGATCL